MVRYAVIAIIATPDTKQQWRTVATALGNLITPARCSGSGGDQFCETYTLNADPTGQTEVLLLLQINGNVANNLQNELQDVVGINGAIIHNWFPTPVTRAELLRRGLRVAFYTFGCTHYISLEAGENPATKTFTTLIPPA